MQFYLASLLQQIATTFPFIALKLLIDYKHYNITIITTFN